MARVVSHLESYEVEMDHLSRHDVRDDSFVGGVSTDPSASTPTFPPFNHDEPAFGSKFVSGNPELNQKVGQLMSSVMSLLLRDALLRDQHTPVLPTTHHPSSGHCTPPTDDPQLQSCQSKALRCASLIKDKQAWGRTLLQMFVAVWVAYVLTTSANDLRDETATLFQQNQALSLQTARLTELALKVTTQNDGLRERLAEEQAILYDTLNATAAARIVFGNVVSSNAQGTALVAELTQRNGSLVAYIELSQKEYTLTMQQLNVSIEDHLQNSRLEALVDLELARTAAVFELEQRNRTYTVNLAGTVIEGLHTLEQTSLSAVTQLQQKNRSYVTGLSSVFDQSVASFSSLNRTFTQDLTTLATKWQLEGVPARLSGLEQQSVALEGSTQALRTNISALQSTEPVVYQVAAASELETLYNGIPHACFREYRLQLPVGNVTTSTKLSFTGHPCDPWISIVGDQDHKDQHVLNCETGNGNCLFFQATNGLTFQGFTMRRTSPAAATELSFIYGARQAHAEFPTTASLSDTSAVFADMVIDLGSPDSSQSNYAFLCGTSLSVLRSEIHGGQIALTNGNLRLMSVTSESSGVGRGLYCGENCRASVYESTFTGYGVFFEASALAEMVVNECTFESTSAGGRALIMHNGATVSTLRRLLVGDFLTGAELTLGATLVESSPLNTTTITLGTGSCSYINGQANCSLV